MMKAAHDLSVKHRVPCEVSLEARMGCSLGACMGCVVRAFGADGEEQFLRVCLDGPIMDSRKVDWNTPPSESSGRTARARSQEQQSLVYDRKTG